MKLYDRVFFIFLYSFYAETYKHSGSGYDVLVTHHAEFVYVIIIVVKSLQCFDAISWATGRVSGI